MFSVIKPKDPAEAAKKLMRAKKALRRELSFEETGERKISPMAQKKIAERKKQFKRYGIGAGFLLLIPLGFWLFKPFEQGMDYGICKTFIELITPFPQSIYYSEVVSFNDSIRVWYSQNDPFGQYRLQAVQCFFGPHEQYGMGLTRVTIGRREIDPEIVQKFNNALPAIFAYPPDLVYPIPLPNDPRDLQFDFERFRKKIL
ncbi:MAG: hypothetical protein ACK4VI_04690 [Alphaproteobacteria bacterium]